MAIIFIDYLPCEHNTAPLMELGVETHAGKNQSIFHESQQILEVVACLVVLPHMEQKTV